MSGMGTRGVTRPMSEIKKEDDPHAHQAPQSEHQQFLGGIGMQEILMIGLVVLIFFGAKKIPEFMKGLGKGVREFKDGVKELHADAESTYEKKTE